MKDEKDGFHYTYSAPTVQERREIESIRRQYLPADEKDVKIERLRKLNGKVKNTPMIVALALGIAGTLVFGLGLCMILEWSLWIGGVTVGVVGLLPVAAAYPVYRLLLRRRKKKYGAEILKLSEELLEKE